MPVSFDISPTIHNLDDAPAPRQDLHATSPLTSPPISPRPSIDFSHGASRSPPRPIPSKVYRSALSLPSLDFSKSNDFSHRSMAAPDTRKIDDEESGNDGSDKYESEDGDTAEQGQVDHLSDDESSQPHGRFWWSLCFMLPPQWRKEMSYNRVSASVVQYAPCFWCMAGGDRTDRNLLYRLNILCAFFASCQTVSGLLMLLTQVAGGLANESKATGRTERNYFAPSLWSLDETIMFLGLVGFAVLVTTVVTLPVIREVRMVGSIRYMWALLSLIPTELFFTVSLLDVFRVSDVWVKHWWYVKAFSWYRERTCATGTSETRCVVPICGLPLFGKDAATLPYLGTDSQECINGESSWCSFFYNATDCRAIRNDAQTTMERWCYLFFTLNFVWGVLLVILLLLTINTLESVITKPVVQKAKESNVTGWLTLPIIFSSAAGAIMMFSPNSVLSVSSQSDPVWIGACFLGIGGLFFVAAMLGKILATFTITSNLDKRTKQLVVWLFILTLACTLCAIVVIFSLSITYSIDVIDVGISTKDRGDIACGIDTVESCSFCNSTKDLVECPEWTAGDVTNVIRTQLKQSAILAAILSIFASGVLRFGLVLRRHIAEYEIDYV